MGCSPGRPVSFKARGVQGCHEQWFHKTTQTLALLQNMSQSCVHQHTCSYTPGTHDPGICPMHCKIRYFPIISPCCPLLPHSPSAYPIKSPESLPFTLCHLSSITITLRFPCRVGLWEAATERKQKSTETPEKNHSFTWKGGFKERRFPPGGEFSLSKELGRKNTALPSTLQHRKPSGNPGPETACPVPHNRCWT